MSGIAEVQRRKTDYLAKARQAAEAGRVTEAKAFRQKAELADEALSELKSIAALETAQAFRPPLPGTADDLPTPDRAQAAYAIRFGSLDGAVKGILTDLHGENYEGAYWQQRADYVIKATLDHTHGDKQLAAQLLGISARTIYRKLPELAGGEET